MDKKIKLFNKWDMPPVVEHEVGDKIVEHYKYTYDDNHEQILVLESCEDIDALIQSYKESTGLYNVLAMILKTDGQPGLAKLDASHATFDDITMMPDNFNDAVNLTVNNSAKADASLAALNAKLGTKYTAQTLAEAIKDGSLMSLIDKLTNVKEDKKDE